MKTLRKGLTEEGAKARLQRFGKNILEVKKANPWWKILLRQFTDLLVIILFLAAGISFLSGEGADAIVIFIIVLLNGIIGFVQEFRTEKTIEALKKMIHPVIRVMRDGREILIQTELLVPGDIVILAEGDKIPADGILLESNSLRADESALTGESVPVEKKEKDKIFMGTSVVRGSGVFEVEKTGMQTKFGQIAHLTATTPQDPSPLQKELAHIGIFVTKVTVVMSIILFIVGFLRGRESLSLMEKIAESLMFAVSVAVAAVPEGLPTTLTVALALGATILARKKAIIKRLSSVETLGAVTTICSDKTGTLTQNEMTVREIYLGDRSIFQVTGAGYDPYSGKISFLGGNELGEKKALPILEKIIEICEKCTEAKLIKKDAKYSILGDPTEGALITLSQKAQISLLQKSESLKKRMIQQVETIFPFDSERKLMSVVSGGNVLVKGSPDQLLSQCTHWHDGESIQRLTKEKLKKIQAHYERMAGNALRVLGFAYREVSKTEKIKNNKEAEKGLIFLGLVGMIDPPRPEVKEAVFLCQTAGIRIIVITGDFGITAEAIARELGIVRSKEVVVLKGEEVQNMTDEQIEKYLKNKNLPIIFARSLPEQKMRIVDILQKQGEIVAMTGDGVNDAPALKSADIGVAMGIAGTEVSKEAATMILTDDSFASIVSAVSEGRRIYDNLKKFIWFIFSCNFGELMTIFLAIIFNVPLPLTAILILCIDVGTDILPAIALGVDEGAKDIMKRAPRDRNLRVMNKSFVKNFLFSGVVTGLCVMIPYIWDLSREGWGWGMEGEGIEHPQTIAFTTLVLIQLVQTFSARVLESSAIKQNFFGNHFLILANTSSILMVLAMVYIPFLNNALGTTPLSMEDWEIILLFSVIPFLVIEMRKYFLHKKGKNLLS